MRKSKTFSKPYLHAEDIHNFEAPKEVIPIVLSFTSPKSVLDIGCGTGTWLKIFEESGVEDYLGVDGGYVDRDLLKIPQDKFLAHDLTKKLLLDRKFDLVISLEVAEHLPEENADSFVETLITHGDTILFSAAIPGQGGQRHLNEQWPSYWQNKFARHGRYFHDVVRPLIWENDQVHWWYRQNIFLITNKPPLSSTQAAVHPECFKHQVNSLEESNRMILSGGLGIYNSLMIFLRSVKKSLLKIL